jgi:dihydroxyacetone kinase phosphotransfer subunit
MTVSLVVVSHSTKLAEGVIELAGQMARGKVAMAAAGGTIEGTLGTSMEKILAALQQVASPDGTLILLDLGSAVMAAEMAIELFCQDQARQVMISSGPLVEGCIIAAVEASVGNTLEEVAEAALNALTLPKVHHQDDV